VTAELVAEASLPEDQVRTLRDVLSRNLKQFTRLHPALTTLTPESMQAGDILPLHPGMLDAAPTLLPDAPSGAEATSGALPTAPSAPTSAATPLEGAEVLPEQPAGATLPASSDAVTTEQAPALTTQPTPTEARSAQGSEPDAAGITTPSAAKGTAQAPTEAPAPGSPSGASPLTGETPAPAQ